MTKIIETGYQREISVIEDNGIYLHMKETGYSNHTNVRAFLSEDKAIELATALLEATGRSLGELVKEQAEKAERENAEKLKKRRDALALQFSTFHPYAVLNPATRSAIDYIIELEDAAKP